MPTLKDTMAKALISETEVNKLKDQLQQKQKEHQDNLRELLKVEEIDTSKSFSYGGKYYNIRRDKKEKETGDGSIFWCVSDKPFGSWLKKDKK